MIIQTYHHNINKVSIETASFLRAMEDAGAVDPKQCYFVDDSAQNIDAAQVIFSHLFQKSMGKINIL